MSYFRTSFYCANDLFFILFHCDLIGAKRIDDLISDKRSDDLISDKRTLLYVSFNGLLLKS
jgi:hypothetical protein